MDVQRGGWKCEGQKDVSGEKKEKKKNPVSNSRIRAMIRHRLDLKTEWKTVFSVTVIPSLY